MTTSEDPYKGWYNGFSMEERRAVNPLLRAAQVACILDAPRTCSICGTVQSNVAPIRMEWHLEDYRDYLRPYPICHNCHWVLHARFSQPNRWIQLVSKCYGDSWVHKLTMDPRSKARPFNETYPFGIPINR
jgi:hypothetical protein